MGRINPRVDIAFKKIFGSEENKDLLISLINAVVGEDDQVTDVTLLNPYNQKNFKEDKLSILDIKAKGSTGKRFNIEIQITDEADYDKRALYYWAKMYAEQIKESDDYSSLEKVIGIHILNFISIPEVNKYHNVFHITEKETGLLYFKDLELHTIELKKFRDTLESGLVDKIRNSLDMWSAFLTRHDLLSPAHLTDPHLKKAIEVLDIINFNADEREAYDNRLHWLRIEASGLKKAEAKGMEKGMKKGMEKGIEIGVAQGREQVAEAIARAMLRAQLSVEQISELTGLSVEKVKEL